MTIQDVYMACETAYAQTIKNTLDLMLRDTAYCSEALTIEEMKKIEEMREWFDRFERGRIIALFKKGLV